MRLSRDRDHANQARHNTWNYRKDKPATPYRVPPGQTNHTPTQAACKWRARARRRALVGHWSSADTLQCVDRNHQRAQIARWVCRARRRWVSPKQSLFYRLPREKQAKRNPAMVLALRPRQWVWRRILCPVRRWAILRRSRETCGEERMPRRKTKGAIRQFGGIS